MKKEKKQIKEAEEKAKEEESKANPNLLKPTDIPAKVMEDKKNLINNKKKNGENGGTDGKNSESSTTNNSKKDKNTEESSSGKYVCSCSKNYRISDEQIILITKQICQFLHFPLSIQ